MGYNGCGSTDVHMNLTQLEYFVAPPSCGTVAHTDDHMISTQLEYFGAPPSCGTVGVASTVVIMLLFAESLHSNIGSGGSHGCPGSFLAIAALESDHQRVLFKQGNFLAKTGALYRLCCSSGLITTLCFGCGVF